MEKRIMNNNLVIVIKKESYFYENQIGTRHLDCLKDFCCKHDITINGNSEKELGLELAMNGYVNIQQMGDAAIFYLPSQLNLYQIEFLKENEELIRKKYSYIETAIYSDKKTDYNSDYRDLQIEGRIYRKNFNNNIDLLYEEINNQVINQKQK